tara:strand:+ start:635 stop:1111 length:477 start_codon:yes stop_codon:yes gene_type:complete
VSLSIKELNYDNLDELRKLESALKNWFANPKELNFTDSEMRYPFDMKKWININYRLNKIQTVVLSKDDWIIGYGGVKFIEKNNRAHIAQIYLDPKHRGTGLKKRIINYIEDLSKKNNHSTVSITAMKKDESSRALYNDLGFVEIEILGNKISMEKKIS